MYFSSPWRTDHLKFVAAWGISCGYGYSRSFAKYSSSTVPAELRSCGVHVLPRNKQKEKSALEVLAWMNGIHSDLRDGKSRKLAVYTFVKKLESATRSEGCISPASVMGR